MHDQSMQMVLQAVPPCTKFVAVMKACQFQCASRNLGVTVLHVSKI